MVADRRPAIRAVLFDLGGTLVDTSDFVGCAEEALRFGIDVAPEDIAHWVEAIELGIDRTGETPALERYWKEVLEGAIGGSVPLEVARELADRLRRRPFPVHLYSDTRRCLDTLAGTGRTLGVVSNSVNEERVREILDRAEIGSYFSLLVSSGTEGVRKPDPEIFRRAVDRLRLEPSEVFYVGDLPNTDAKAAARAGLKSVWLNRAGTGFGEDPPEITSLLELPLAIERAERERAPSGDAPAVGVK